MDHPNIAHVFDAGMTVSGRPYFVMEYVEGIPITKYCDKHKLSIEERLQLFLQVCEAVRHAHQKGIIHRDIKSSNILVSTRDNQAVPKIIDFGIVKALTQSLTERTLYTEQGQFIGTPAYMSPEQVEMSAQGVDTQTDIYSLGVVLYKLLAGVLPFDTEALREGGTEHMRRVICEQDPKTPSTRLRTVSGEKSTKLAQLRRTDVRAHKQKLHGDLDWTTLKAMEKNPNRRYPTAHALAEDIRRHLNHEPVTAGSPTIIYRLRKFVRRNRTQVIAGACVVVVVLMGLLSFKLYKQNIADKKKLAEEKRNHAFQKAETMLSTADAYYGEGQYEPALEQTALLLELVPDHLNGRLLAARILTDMGRTEEAFQILERLEAEHPEEGAVYELLAMLYVELGNEALATRYRTLVEKYPPKTVEAFIVRARTAETLDDMIGMLSEALNLDRRHYAAREMRALTYFALGDYENMERDADKMTFVQPENPSGYALRAVALRQMERYAEAIENHNRAIEVAGDTYPDITELYDQRRETYFRMGDYEQALADAKECVERRPDAARYKCGLLGALVALGRYNEADAESATPPGLLTYHFVPRLAKYVANCFESGRELSLPDRTESGPTARLLRITHRGYQELYSKARRLVPNGAAADYSPDGRKMVYARFNPEKIWQHETPLTHPQIPGSKGIDIIEDPERSTIRSVVNFGHFPRCSPDGKYIAFVKSPFSFRSAFEQMYIIPAEGGVPSYLGKGVLLGWSRDGKKMLLVIGNPMWEIWEADIDPNRPTVESLGPGMAKQEHCRDMIAEMEDWLVVWSRRTRATLSGRLAAFCHAGLGHEDEAVKGLDKWLRSLSTWPETQPPTYWQMANCVLDCYEPGTDDGNAALSLAAKVAELAQDSWAGEVLAGMAHYRAGAYEDAMAHLEHAEQLRVQGGAKLYPDQVALTVMTLYRLGRRQEAEEALGRLRTMFVRNTSHDDFQPLVKAEKVFTEESRPLPAVWDHIELGYLDKALELLIAARESLQRSDSEVHAATMSAQRQLALRFAARGQGYEQRGEYGRAAKEFESAAAAAPWHTEMLNLLARFHATCPDAEFRDGASAVQNATKACELSNWDNYNYIDTLAAAFARAGRFEQAVKWQSQAITKLPEDIRPGSRAQFQAKLQLYREGQSYHGQYLLAGKLIARYSFDDISGNTVPDSSGNKIDGTFIGDARVVDDPVRGKVLELDGDGDGVDCGNDSLFGIAEQITISSWIKVNGLVEHWRTIISKGSSWKLQSWPKTLKFVCGVNVPGDIGVDSGIRGKKNIDDGRWHHVAGVYDGKTTTLYIDGRSDVSARTSGRITANRFNVWIGSDSQRSERTWNGLIDDVRIYSYALSEDEIRELYAGNEPAH